MELSEVAPPGFGHTKGDKKKGVEKGGTAAAFDRARKEGRFKGSKSDMFAIMWSQKNKGDKPHYKPGTDEKYKKYQKEELTGDMKTDLEKYRVPRGPGGNPIRIGDKVRSMKGDQPLGKLKVKYGADKVREYYKKNRPVGEEVEVDEGITATHKGTEYKLLPGKVRKAMKGKAKGGLDGDYRDGVGKAKDWVTDKLGITNTKRDGVKCPKGLLGHQDCNSSYEPEGEMVEGFSDWRKELDEGGYHRIEGEYEGKGGKKEKVSGKFLKLPHKVGKGVKRNTDHRHELGKIKDAVTDTLGITNTKRDGVRKHDGIKGAFQMQNGYEPEGEVTEGVVDAVKKGAKRHAKAIEKKKIKNRKAVPYAALGASYEPEGEMVQELFGLGNKKYPYGKATKKNPRGKRDQAELDRAQAYIKKNPKFGMKEGVVDEAKVEKGYISNLSKAQARNERRFGKKGSTTPQGYFGQKPSQAAELSAKRTAEHKARRGVKEGVLGAASGAVLGGAVGGPAGALAGAALGSKVDVLGDKKKSKVTGTGKKRPTNYFKAKPKVTTSEAHEYAERRAKDRQKFVDFYKKAQEAKAKKQADSTRSDSRRHGIKFSDAKGSGRIRAGKKIYD